MSCFRGYGYRRPLGGIYDTWVVGLYIVVVVVVVVIILSLLSWISLMGLCEWGLFGGDCLCDGVCVCVLPCVFEFLYIGGHGQYVVLLRLVCE